MIGIWLNELKKLINTGQTKGGSNKKMSKIKSLLKGSHEIEVETGQHIVKYHGGMKESTINSALLGIIIENIAD